MSIAFEEVRVLERQDTFSVSEDTLPKPEDKKIAEGEALRGELGAEHILKIEQRLDKAFVAIDEDQSREAGECIAYGLGLDVIDETVVDHHLVFQATALLGRDVSAYTMGPDATAENGQASANLWRGFTKEREYRLRKHLGHIILNDSTVEPRGIVYSLLSTRR